MSGTPPAFQEAARCDVCKCSFTTFRRRHHCRCCGRTLCHEHSSNHMALPQFGIYSNVRVCSDCFNNSTRYEIGINETSSEGKIDVAHTFSRLDLGEAVNSNVQMDSGKLNMNVPDCKCGMPLCICDAPVPEPTPLQVKNVTASNVQAYPRPKKSISSQSMSEKKLASSSTSKLSPLLNFSQATQCNLQEARIDYDVSGEGLREAIKNGDIAAVKELLTKGVDASYCDKQGLTLLHLATLFNQTDIAFILMDNGASVDCKNAQGETPLDCAPVMLQYKMRKKLEEGNEKGSPVISS